MKQREILFIISKGVWKGWGWDDVCSAYVKYKHLLGESNDRLFPSDFATSLNFTACRRRRKEGRKEGRREGDVLRMIGLA
jgi:hypothetical protein